MNPIKLGARWLVLFFVFSVATAIAGNESYTYDELGRLKTVTTATGQDTKVVTYNYDPAGNRTVVMVTDTVHFSITDTSVAEGGQLAFDVTLNGTPSSTHNVSYSTTFETTGTSDLTSVSGTLNFSTADETQSISVQSTGDSTFENDETFKIVLSSATNGASISDGEGQGTIDNDDTVPAFSVNDVSADESVDIQFQVSMAGSSAFSHNVSYSTANGTAVAGSDYTTKSGTLTFNDGDPPKTVTVVVNDDSDNESDETLTLQLSSPSNGATLADGTGQGTILDNDVANSPPNAVSDSVWIDGIGTTVNAYVLSNDSDPDGDPLDITGVTQPSNAVVTISPGPKLVIRSTRRGFSSFTYTIDDGNGGTDSASVSVEVDF